MRVNGYQEEKPELVQVTVGHDNITEQMKVLYGEDKDWNHRTIHFKDFLTEKDIGKDVYVKWQRASGRIDCVITRVRDLEAVFHGDLFHPSKKLKLDGEGGVTSETIKTASSNHAHH